MTLVPLLTRVKKTSLGSLNRLQGVLAAKFSEDQLRQFRMGFLVLLILICAWLVLIFPVIFVRPFCGIAFETRIGRPEFVSVWYSWQHNAVRR